MSSAPKSSKSTPPKADTGDSNSLSPVLPTPSQSTSASVRQTRQRLERQLAENEKLLQESSSGIGKNVLAGQISQIKDQLRDLDHQRHQQRRDDPLERLRSLEREYRSNNSTMDTSSKTLDLTTSPSTPDFLPLPPAPTSNATPTKRRSKVPSADRRNTDIEFATEIGQGLLIEVRKMQALLQQKEEQLSQIEIQKTDLERAVEAMAKQLRQREEIHEKLKEETWDLELAKQELTSTVTELQQNLQKSTGEQARFVRQMNNLKAEMERMRDQEEKLAQQLETTKTRHEHDMGVMRRHGAQLQREKAEQKKQIDALTSELAIAKAQSRIQKRSHVDLDHQYHQQAHLLAGEKAVNADAADSTDSNAETSLDAGTSDAPPGSPKHKALEVETLKSSLAHAHRMVSNLRGNLHREKQEKFELKKLLAESQEVIEQMQNVDMWVDRPGSLQQQQYARRLSSTKALKQKRHKASGKHGRKVKNGATRAARSASASPPNKEDDDLTEYYDDEDDAPEESEYSSGGDEDNFDEDETMMVMTPAPAVVGLSLADQLRTATQMVTAATQTDHSGPIDVAVAPQVAREQIGVQTDMDVPIVVVAQGKDFITQTDAAPVAKTEEASTQTDGVEVDILKAGHNAETISSQPKFVSTPTAQDHHTQTEDRQLTIQSQIDKLQSFAPVTVAVKTTETGPQANNNTMKDVPNIAPTMVAKTDDDGTLNNDFLALSTPTEYDAACTQTAVVSTEDGSTQTDTVAVVGVEIGTQTDGIPQPVSTTKDFSAQTSTPQYEEMSTQTEEQKRFSTQGSSAPPLTVMVATAAEKGVFRQQQGQLEHTSATDFGLPPIPIVSVTGFDSRPPSMAADATLVAGPPTDAARSGSEETSGTPRDVEMITRAEADAMVAAAVQAAIKPYLDTHKAKEGEDAKEDPPQRPLNRPPSVLLSKATQRLASMHGGTNEEGSRDFGTAYVNAQAVTYANAQSQHRHFQHQRRDSDSSASTAHTADHRRPSFSSAQVNEATETANQHGISDPGAIALITQTMIGDWLWKYTRKAVGGGISEHRHKRFFWIHPYTRTLYWSAHAPGVDGKESKAKSALIENITTIPEHTPLGAAHVSMLIQTPGRQLRITAPDMSRHEVWFESLSYLLERADASAGDQDSKKSSSSVDPRCITPSLSTNSLLKQPSFPRLRPARSVSSFAGSVSSNTTTGSSNSKRMQHRQQRAVHDNVDGDDDDDEALEDVRMCCNGKHHVSKLGKDPYHHHYQRRPANTNPHRSAFHA
ncbi:hypothetical protein BX666DRAFT_1875071 [Dichotomocladium elegans]|nr:hypothetical protein BX666DRAFT_1875071 [Dichotomocladium elegans]